MTSPPMTNREYAYFRVTGLGKHETITKILGFEPSEAWSEGDENPRTGKQREFMSWVMKSGHDDTEPMDRHIQSLLIFLGTRASSIQKLWVEYDLFIQCVGYYPPSGHGTHLDRETVRQAARLGLSFDMDYYFTDDHGHEV